MTSFSKVTPEEFDTAVKSRCVEDEHEFLESRFLDRNKRVIAKVIRYLNEEGEGELKPEADLLVAIDYQLESENS
jgi:hypothetical protein